MSNKKKLKSRDGATRIAKSEEFYGLFRLQTYNERRGVWEPLEGCDNLTWKEAAQARKNYVALRKACKVANGASLHINVPTDEGNGN
nr:MAG TPA: hypothetical protein [Caudoviricetes sp.]